MSDIPENEIFKPPVLRNKTLWYFFEEKLSQLRMTSDEAIKSNKNSYTLMWLLMKL